MPGGRGGVDEGAAKGMAAGVKLPGLESSSPINSLCDLRQVTQLPQRLFSHL